MLTATRGRILELTVRDDGETETIPETDANFWASIERMARHMGLSIESATRRLNAGEQLTGSFCLYRFVPADEPQSMAHDTCPTCGGSGTL